MPLFQELSCRSRLKGENYAPYRTRRFRVARHVPGGQTAGGAWGSVLLLIVLILVNAFFAACEIAVITLNDAKIEKMAGNGDKKPGKF